MWGGWLKFFAQSYSYHKSRRQATLILVENLNSLLPCCVLPNQLFPVDWTWSNWSTLFVLCPPSTAGNNKLIKLLSPPDIHFICMPCYLSKFSCTSTAWVGQPSSLCPNVMGWGADNFFLQDIALQILSSQVRVVHSKQRRNRVDFDFAPAAINYRTEIRATASLKRGMCIWPVPEGYPVSSVIGLCPHPPLGLPYKAMLVNMMQEGQGNIET